MAADHEPDRTGPHRGARPGRGVEPPQSAADRSGGGIDGAPSGTAALLALLTGAQVVVGAARSLGDGRFLLRLRSLEPEPGGDPATEVRRLTRRITAVLEQWIRDDSGRWRWVHWRWKHRPGGGRERYGRRELERCFRS